MTIPRFRALYEDQGHEQWLRGLADLAGVPTRNLFLDPKPKGGSGEQWVREQLPARVKEHRSLKNAQRALWLIVFADADLEDRIRVLEEAISKAHLAPLTPEDRVIMLIPARNIETWAWCLLGNAVDESTDFKPHVERSGQKLRDLVVANWPTPSPGEPPSLIRGRAEWNRPFA